MNFNQKILWAAVVCAALASQGQQVTNNLALASDANAVAHSSGVVEGKYVIGPEDVLNINVWRQPELSAVAVPVRPDGKISLPLLNDVQAANLTPMQLVAAITEQLKKFVSDPQVTVVVAAINSKRIYVMGEVVRAGVFPMAPNMTVLQALSSAGGFQQYANPKKIYILRRNEAGKNRKITFNYKRAIQGGQTEGDILLMPGDTIVVP